MNDITGQNNRVINCKDLIGYYNRRLFDLYEDKDEFYMEDPELLQTIDNRLLAKLTTRQN